MRPVKIGRKPWPWLLFGPWREMPFEAFTSGLDNLNHARTELDLGVIDEPWHNLFLDETNTRRAMENLDRAFVEENCFLSGFYFGSRIILPAITPRHKKVTFESPLNDYFCHWPPNGDFCPMKILCFEKR